MYYVNVRFVYLEISSPLSEKLEMDGIVTGHFGYQNRTFRTFAKLNSKTYGSPSTSNTLLIPPQTTPNPTLKMSDKGYEQFYGKVERFSVHRNAPYKLYKDIAFFIIPIISSAWLSSV